jgi:hypothetical protein
MYLWVLKKFKFWLKIQRLPSVLPKDTGMWQKLMETPYFLSRPAYSESVIHNGHVY